MQKTQIDLISQKQNLASNPKNSAWVFASAGSGKTKILTDRVLRLLLDDICPSKILCLTFTNAGAKEMQIRINNELSSWSIIPKEQLQEKLTKLTGQNITQNYLNKAQSLFFRNIDNENKIKVQTIHSFCQNLIKIFPFEANISPTFEILEEKQEKILIKKSIDEVFNEATNNNHIKNLITNLSSKIDEENFYDLIYKILNQKSELIKINSHYLPQEISNKYNEILDLNDEATIDSLLNKINEIIKADNCQNIFNKLQESPSKKNSNLYQEFSKINNQISQKNFFELKNIFFNNKNQIRTIYDKLGKDEEFINDFNYFGQILAKLIDKINAIIIKNDSLNLLELSNLIITKYNDAKKKSGNIDYNDLIILTNNLLQNPEFSDWIKMKMDSNFDHILVDESQDTNHQQWDIIKALCEDFFSGQGQSNNNRSIFIVGDEKQSIYSFQGANPKISVDIYNFFKEKLGDKLLNIQINNSFRSQPQILKLVDDIFLNTSYSNAICKTYPYQEHKAIKAGQGHVEIWPIINQKNNQEQKNDDYKWQLDFLNNNKKYHNSEIMAKLIAYKINEKITKENYQFGDFMILLRKRNEIFDKALMAQLDHYNIEFISQSKIKFNDNLLLNDLITLSKFCLLKEDDLTLCTLLKSPFFNYQEQQILEICNYKNQHKISVFASLKNIEKYHHDFEILNNFIQDHQKYKILEFYYLVLYQQNYYKNFIAYFGDKAQEIINSFLNFIDNFSQKYSHQSQIFLEYLEKFDYDLSPILNSQNKLLISTIHSAKGLQAKVVIMPDCSYNFSQLLATKEKIFYQEINDLKLPIFCAKKENENDKISELKNNKIKLAKEEYLRLLYVGLTRAEDELYIGGFGNAKDPQNWYEIINKYIKAKNPKNFEELITKLSNDKITNQELTTNQEVKTNYQTSFNKKSNINNDVINQQIIYGNLAHKILEIITTNYQQPIPKLLNLSKNIIANNNQIKLDKKELLQNQISNFLNSKLFKELFFDKNNLEILCEKEISYNNKLYRLDLIIIRQDEILIIDYKTDNNSQNQEKYRQQLRLYQEALGKIYQDKKITGAILAINDLQLIS